MTTTTINAPSSAALGVPFTATANPSGGVKALRVDAGETFAFNENIPYPFTVTYLDGSTASQAAYLNDSSQPTVSTENANWLYDVNGVLLFDSNKNLLQVP